MVPTSRTVLVVEDDPRYSSALTPILASAGVEATFARTLSDARCSLARAIPDVCLVDLSLPDGNGELLIRQLAMRIPPIPSIVLTVATAESRILSALRAGASGYLFKEDAGRIVNAIDEALAGGAPMSTRVAQIVLRELRAGRVVDPCATSAVGLTQRETEVVHLLAKGLSYTEVGLAMSVSTNTVRSHVRSIYEKLAVSTKTEAVLEAMRLGVIAS